LDGRLDQDRRGAELKAAWERQWRAGRLELAGGALLSRVEPDGGESVNQRLGFLNGRLTATPSRGLWSFPSFVEARFDLARTGEDSWRRYGGALEVGAVRRGTGLTLSWRRTSVRDAVLDLDRLQLGGVASSILPESALAGRIVVPALAAGTGVGDEHEGQRGTVLLGGVPLFFERHRIWGRSGPRGEWLRLGGVAWDMANGPLPLVRLPGFHLTVGVARILDEPFRNVTEGWFGLAWRP
jgi:hypothetical protein